MTLHFVTLLLFATAFVGCDVFGNSLESERFEGTLRYTAPTDGSEAEVYDLGGEATFRVSRRLDGDVEYSGALLSTGSERSLVSLLTLRADGDLLTRTGTFTIGDGEGEVSLGNLCVGSCILLSFDGTLHIRSFGDEIEASFEAASGGSGFPLYEIEGSFRATVDEESLPF